MKHVVMWCCHIAQWHDGLKYSWKACPGKQQSSIPCFSVGWTVCGHLVVQDPIILHNNARSHTAAAVTDLLHRWQWEIVEHPPYSPDMSPCDYNVFAKVKEPLWGTLYNTRDELIHAIERSLRKINKNWRSDHILCSDGVWHLPNIWQKIINKGGGDYIEGI